MQSLLECILLQYVSYDDNVNLIGGSFQKKLRADKMTDPNSKNLNTVGS